MTRKFKLPDVLGGGVHEEYRHVSGTTEAPTGTVAFLVEGHIVCVAAGLLTEVKVLPEEPPVGSFVLVDRRAFHRRDDEGINWWDYADQTWLTWKLICDLGTPVRLVPDPFAEPVELPWQGASLYGTSLQVAVGADDPINLVVGSGGASVDAAGARMMARALLTAAAEWESSNVD